MIYTLLGIIISFWMLGLTFHAAIAMYQVFFGLDGRRPWDTNPNLTYDEEMERWWEFGY